MIIVLFRAAPSILFSLYNCGAKSLRIRGQNNLLVPVGTFPRSLTSIFRTAPSFVNVHGAFTKGTGVRNSTKSSVVADRTGAFTRRGDAFTRGFTVINCGVPGA